MDNLMLNQKSYGKSNLMISAKFKSSLLENKLMAIALTRIETEYKDGETVLKARLYPGELKELISDPNHIYRDLAAVSKSIIGHTMFLEDGNGNFQAFAVVPNAKYEDGVFEIEFNRKIKEHILGLDKNYTLLKLSIMTGFSSNATFRIYELLKKDLYRCDPKVNGGRFNVEYNLCEFRFLIGIANSDNPFVKKAVDSMKEIDWDELYTILIKKGSKYDAKYKEPSKLKKDILDVAQKEIGEKSDLRFDYELIKIGRAYKKILFSIYPNRVKEATQIEKNKEFIERLQEPRQMEIPMDSTVENQHLYEKYVGHAGLAKEDIDLLLKKADWDASVVESAIKYADKQDVIENYVGYLVRAVEQKWYDTEPIVVVNGSKEKGDRIKEAQEIIKNRTDEEEKIRLADIWKKNFMRQPKIYQNFMDYLDKEKGLPAKVVEMTYVDYELGAMLIEFIREGKCELPIG
ncbi:Initiator Replication protein [Lachnospiraceae bacterium KHCPX20]|nr:Initiator Replication protein [Lachnospiraceae bacterium KHCPX20]